MTTRSEDSNLQPSVPKAILRRLPPRASLDLKCLFPASLGMKQAPLPACPNVQILQHFPVVASDSVPDSVSLPEGRLEPLSSARASTLSCAVWNPRPAVNDLSMGET